MITTYKQRKANEYMTTVGGTKPPTIKRKKNGYMKDGYIVWNESTVENEFFGVFKGWQAALRHYRKVVKNRYGKCPRNYDDIIGYLADVEPGEDSLRITYFKMKEV